MGRMFRLLRADEIEARIQSVKSNGAVLLLYKDARVDQSILDETVGPMNWEKSYSRDNANCTVSIWDENKQRWVSKEDTGTESNTEAAKGLASDSFKRACFNWGIGRELYTAPLTWVKAEFLNINGNKCYDHFKVTRIEYDELDRISALEIYNLDKRCNCFSWKNKAPVKASSIMTEKPVNAPKTAPAGKDVLICDRCGKTVSTAEYDYSYKKFGAHLCRACQREMD